MNVAAKVPAVLLYCEGEPRRIVEHPTHTPPVMLSDVTDAAQALAAGRAALVAPDDVEAVLDELREN